MFYDLLSGTMPSSLSRAVVVVNPLRAARHRRDVNASLSEYTTSSQNTEHSTVGVAYVTSASRVLDVTTTSGPLQSDTNTAQTTWSASTSSPINVKVVNFLLFNLSCFLINFIQPTLFHFGVRYT